MAEIVSFSSLKTLENSCIGNTHFYSEDALDCYGHWPAPTMIHIDGPYGIGGFPGDPTEYAALPSAYYQHVAAWSRFARANTTLWFWGTELGWATVHPLLEQAGWQYEELCIWNKGLSHIAGNVNSKTIRGVPVVTEVCARYTWKAKLPSGTGKSVSLQEWMREEWLRSGVPLCRANEACGVKNAATRKYLTKDKLWYFPPAEMMVMMARYLKAHGAPTTRPYFSLDGKNPLTESQWNGMRAKWNHKHGYTNVWNVPSLNGKERLRIEGSKKSLHLNQKPEQLMRYLIETTTDEGDVVWDPFAGLATMGVQCNALSRICYCSESNPAISAFAKERLEKSVRKEKKCRAL